MLDQEIRLMVLKHFYIALSDDDFLIKNPEGSEFPYRNDPIVADFNFQTDYFSLFIEKELKKLKFETGSFNMIMIRGRRNPKLIPYIEKHHNCLTIEVFFDEEKYREIYPHINEYPLRHLLIPVENQNELSAFLVELVMKAMEVAKKHNVDIPVDFIVDNVLDFKRGNFKNRWIYKRKNIPRTDLVAKLVCSLTCNSFKLDLILEKKSGVIQFEETILETLPSSIQYKGKFKNLEVKNELLIVTKGSGEKLYELNFRALEEINC